MSKINELILIANEKYDGHFTLKKFTTNWRCCFGTLYYNENHLLHHAQIKAMAEGKTMEEAIDNCIKDNVNCYDIEKDVEYEFKHNTKGEYFKY